MPPQPQSKEEYFAAFKKLRNRLKKYDAGAVVLACIERLHLPDANTARQMSRQPPWVLLMLMKWAIIYGDFSNYDKIALTDGELNRLINMMHAIENAAPLPTDNLTMLGLLRPLAYQQFWHQQDLSLESIVRQAIYFDGLSSGHTFRRWFKEDTGIEINDFLELAFMVMASFVGGKIRYVEDSFFSKATGYPPRTADNFFAIISKTPDEIKKYLVEVNKDRQGSPSEWREQTPLIRYPLLRLGIRHYSYSRRLLAHALHSLVYDTLRRRDPNAFMDKFGHMFEEYVREALQSANIEFLDEKAILQMVEGRSKVTDFLIVESHVNVFIDAKGIEVGHLGMTSHCADVVADKLKTSVVKGIVQGIELVSALRSSSSAMHVNWDTSRNFLLLVTYKDLLLGTGQDFYEVYAKERLTAALNHPPDKLCIPLEHIYIISANEFDCLIGCIMERRVTFSDILKDAVSKDGQSQTKKLQLVQHLYDSFGKIQIPQYALRKFEELTDRVKQRFADTRQSD